MAHHSVFVAYMVALLRLLKPIKVCYEIFSIHEIEMVLLGIHSVESNNPKKDLITRD